MFARFLKWLMESIGLSPTPGHRNKPSPKAPEKEPAKPEPPEATPKVAADDPDYPIASASTWMQLLEQNAQAWERDQRKYMAALKQYGRTGAAEAILALDWAKVMRGYSPDVLTKVFSEGTLLSLQGHPQTKKVIQAAAKLERARRNKGTKAPSGRGMNEKGGQK